MTEADISEQTAELEIGNTEHAANGTEQPQSKSAKKRAKQKAKKAAENAEPADAPAGSLVGPEQQAAPAAVAGDNEADSGDEDDEEGEAEGAYPA